jgi:hypothetical protein
MEAKVWKWVSSYETPGRQNGTYQVHHLWCVVALIRKCIITSILFKLVDTSVAYYLIGCRVRNLGLSIFIFNLSSLMMRNHQKHMVDVLLQAWSTVERSVAWIEVICVMELKTAHGVRMNGTAVSYSITLSNMLAICLKSGMKQARGTRIPSMQMPFSFP